MKILTEHIVPIVRAVQDGRAWRVVRLYGTAFFVNDEGTFLTAAHVLRTALTDPARDDGVVMLVGTMRNPSLFQVGLKIHRWENAPDSADVAIGATNERVRAAFVGTSMTKLWMWTDVWTAGYPDSATMILQGNPEYPPRGYHGYITRTIPEGDWLGFQHSDLFELSFPVVLGMSGAPLFLRETRALPSFELIGVCIGSRSSEVEEYQHEEVEENGSVSRERRLRVEQYGLAQDIRPLLKWKPELLNGQRLGDAIRSSFGPGRG